MEGIGDITPKGPELGTARVDQGWLDHLAGLAPFPKILHACWSNKEVINAPETGIEFGLRSMRDMNPDWELRLVDDDEMKAYIQARIPAADWVLLQAQHIVELTDVWRLLVIYYEGGFYQDMDRFYNKPLADVLGPETRMLLPTFQDVNFAQDLMGSSPCNDVYRTALERNLVVRRKMQRRHLDDAGTIYKHDVREIGPGQLLRVHHTHRLRVHVLGRQGRHAGAAWAAG
jgi:hypothetical protein